MCACTDDAVLCDAVRCWRGVLLIASAAIGGCGCPGGLRVLDLASVATRECAGEAETTVGCETNVLSAGLGMNSLSAHGEDVGEEDGAKT
jgi:hypothetical protein